MENLDIGNIVFGALVVQAFNLVIILLAKTENILKAVERIKGVVGLDYRKRAKRSDDELRISKKHVQVAKDRIRHSFVAMPKWYALWSWNWSDDFEPENIKGYCTGMRRGSNLYKCGKPVYAYFSRNLDEEEPTYITLGITCSSHATYHHVPIRTTFEVFNNETRGKSADEMVLEFVSKVIIVERDLRIAKEIRKLRRQFWR